MGSGSGPGKKPSAEKIAQRAFDLGLLDERQLQDVWAELGTRNVATDDFLQLLVRREYMTNYQVGRLLKGDKVGFFYGDYKVLYLVGSGTFARVFRAVHRETGKVVALKVLRSRYSDNAMQFGQFIREGRVGEALRHPNIVPIYDVCSHGLDHFLVMEFVEGRNLREFVKIRGKLRPDEATDLMSGICSGMQYAFEHGLTHRDLKMNNILVSSRGQAKLVDFGLAAMDDVVTDDSSGAEMPNSRTIDYAALERATGVRKDDTRSDVYFLGCIYYNMLTGVPPLAETRDRVQRLSKMRFLEVVPIRRFDPEIPDTVALVVNKAMSLDASRRYQAPGLMLHDLKIAKKRLAQLAKGNGESDGEKMAAEQEPGADEIAAPVAPTHSVMVVESNVQMQDIFRAGFKKAGYRVLLTSDPERALSRFRQPGVADCVVFNAQQLGKSALVMFNRFGEESITKSIPAVLLLDEKQRGWKKHAMTSPHRCVLPMPITMKQLRTALGKLMTAAAEAKS